MRGLTSRRSFLRLLTFSSGGLLVACSQPAPVSPTQAAPATAKPAAPAAGPTAAAKSTAQGDRLVVVLNAWGIETPFAWRSVVTDKVLWDPVHDSLIMRDARTLALKPGLALSWTPSADYKTWTFRLRQGVMFHGDWGELTAEDVKFTLEQNLKPDAQGGDAPFFRANLQGIETPDKYTVVLNFKNPLWEVPTHFAQRSGYQNISSKKYLESVGEDKAARAPIGSGPFKFVEGKQGEFYRFQALPNHWRVTPGFKELVIRRYTDPGTALAALRVGEVDTLQVSGDYLKQAKAAGFRLHLEPNSLQYTVVLPGQTLPDKEDFCPQCPWVGDPNDPKSQENAKKVRQALNLAVNKQAIIDGLWAGYGELSPYVMYYYPTNKGFKEAWKVPPYDPARAKQLLAEAGVPNGFEIKVAGPKQVPDAPDVIEAVALDWEKIGIKVKRVQEDWGSFLGKTRGRKTNGVAFVNASAGPFDAPSLVWQRAAWSKGAFYWIAESPEYDRRLEAIFTEMDEDRRAKMESDLGQLLYDDVRLVMLPVKPAIWAVSKKVGEWPTLTGTMFENNLDYLTWSGQA